MRRWLVIVLLVILTAVLGTAGAHRHALGDAKAECTVCTFAQQGVTPATTQALTARPLQSPLRIEICRESVHLADGRRIYRAAPKVSPPSDHA